MVKVMRTHKYHWTGHWIYFLHVWVTSSLSLLSSTDTLYWVLQTHTSLKWQLFIVLQSEDGECIFWITAAAAIAIAEWVSWRREIAFYTRHLALLSAKGCTEDTLTHQISSLLFFIFEKAKSDLQNEFQVSTQKNVPSTGVRGEK